MLGKRNFNINTYILAVPRPTFIIYFIQRNYEFKFKTSEIYPSKNKYFH